MTSISKKANDLRNLGLKEGANIALSGSNSIDWVISFFSIVKIGCTAVPIDPKMNKQSIEFILKFTESKLFLVDKIKNFKLHQDYQSIIRSMDSAIILSLIHI